MGKNRQRPLQDSVGMVKQKYMRDRAYCLGLFVLGSLVAL